MVAKGRRAPGPSGQLAQRVNVRRPELQRNAKNQTDPKAAGILTKSAARTTGPNLPWRRAW